MDSTSVSSMSMSSTDSSSDEESPLLWRNKSYSRPRSEHVPGDADVEGATAGEEEGELSTPALLLVMSSMWLGVFIASVDSTLIANLLVPISTTFDSLPLLSWLASAYFIANAVVEPLIGRLTDIFSRRTGLILCNALFAAGNLICGLATQEWIMITGRVVAGLGGGGLYTISVMVTSDLISLRSRGLWQGYTNVFYLFGAAIGGVAGGILNDVWTWRAAFLLQVGLTSVSVAVMIIGVRIPTKQKSKSTPEEHIDYLGALTIITSVLFLLLGLNSGGNVLPWDHPLILTALPLSFAFLLAFIYIELYLATQPLIPVRLLVNRTVMSCCLVDWFVSMTMTTLFFYAPMYFQVRGYTTTESGLLLIPQAIGSTGGSIGAGLIMRWKGKYYTLNAATHAVHVACLVVIASFTLTTPSWQPFLALFLCGIGYGAAFTVTYTALIAAVEQDHQAVITSALCIFRSTGDTIGITIASAIFQNTLRSKLWQRFGGEKDAAMLIEIARNSFEAMSELPDWWDEGVTQSYMDALEWVFRSLVVLGVLAAGASLWMREHKLHSNLART